MTLKGGDRGVIVQVIVGLEGGDGLISVVTGTLYLQGVIQPISLGVRHEDNALSASGP